MIIWKAYSISPEENNDSNLETKDTDTSNTNSASISNEFFLVYIGNSSVLVMYRVVQRSWN